MVSFFLFFLAASIIFWHSAGFIAIGFSTITCAPLFRASIVGAAWTPLGVQTLTASGCTSLSIFFQSL